MSNLEDAKDFVAKHEKDLDPALGKPAGRLDEPTDRADQAYAKEHAGDDDSAVPEARDL